MHLASRQLLRFVVQGASDSFFAECAACLQGCSNFTRFPKAQQSANLLEKLEAYHSWALTEPRLGGFCPWHFANRAGDGDPGDVCDMKPGVEAFPAVLAKLKEIGGSIVNATIQQR